MRGRCLRWRSIMVRLRAIPVRSRAMLSYRRAIPGNGIAHTKLLQNTVFCRYGRCRRWLRWVLREVGMEAPRGFP